MTQHLKQVLQRRRPPQLHQPSVEPDRRPMLAVVRTRHRRSDTRPRRSDPQCSRLRLAPVGTGRRGNSSAPRVSLLSHPITGIAGCCARAASGHAAAAPPSSVMNSRRLSFDHLVGEREQPIRHLKPELFGCPKVQHQLEFRGLHHRQVVRLLAF